MSRTKEETQSGGGSGRTDRSDSEWMSLRGTQGKAAQEAAGHPRWGFGEQKVSREDCELRGTVTEPLTPDL